MMRHYLHIGLPIMPYDIPEAVKTLSVALADNNREHASIIALLEAVQSACNHNYIPPCRVCTICKHEDRTRHRK